MTKRESYVFEEAQRSKRRGKKFKTTLSDDTSFSMDLFALRFWIILTHAGFVTELHQDSDGLGTFIYAHMGTKIWCVAKPRVKEVFKTRREFFELFETVFSSPDLMEHADCFVMFLNPGDLL